MTSWWERLLFGSVLALKALLIGYAFWDLSKSHNGQLGIELELLFAVLVVGLFLQFEALLSSRAHADQRHDSDA